MKKTTSKSIENTCNYGVLEVQQSRYHSSDSKNSPELIRQSSGGLITSRKLQLIKLEHWNEGASWHFYFFFFIKIRDGTFRSWRVRGVFEKGFEKAFNEKALLYKTFLKALFTKRHFTKRHSTRRHPTKRQFTKRLSTKRHSTKRHPTKRHLTKRHSTKRLSTKRLSTKRHFT